MLTQSQLFEAHVDISTKNYAFGKITGVIIDDIDKNGFVDLVTFPSHFTLPNPIPPLVWSNRNGVFKSESGLISGRTDYQFFRDSIKGDFDGDGYKDFIQIDQGWELENRNPDFFQGSVPLQLRGRKNGLEAIVSEGWLDTEIATKKAFNHIGSTADFDQDGDLDLVIATFGWGFRLYINDGTGFFTWNKLRVPNEYSYGASGTTFIKLGDKYGIVKGYYRANPPYRDGDFPVSVFEQNSDQSFSLSYTLPRPNLGGREKNFGANDMYNVDLNADGREDLIVLWETENIGGIQDGQSDQSANPQIPRYRDISNSIATVYLQDKFGKLIADPANRIYTFQESTAGNHIYFLDFNRDGYLDFYGSTYGISPNKFDQLIWINDKTGGFQRPETPIFQTTESFPSWYSVSPFFFDANNDGAIDILATRPYFGSDFSVRNIGEEVRLFLNVEPTPREHHLAGKRSYYEIKKIGDSTVEVKNGGTELRLANVERLKFSDAVMVLDPPISVGQAYRIYKAAFNRDPMAGDTKGLGYWIAQIDKGMDLIEVSARFVDSNEFRSLYGTNPTNEQFLTKLYQNVLGRQPEASGFNWWLNELNTNPEKTKAKVLADFAESSENQTGVINLIGNGITYEPWVG